MALAVWMIRTVRRRRTGAHVVDNETHRYPNLAGYVRAVTDTPSRSLGRLKDAVDENGKRVKKVIAKAFLLSPVRSTLASIGAIKAMRALRSLTISL